MRTSSSASALFLALAALIFAGCSSDDNPAAPIPDPIADFTMSGATVTPATITFTNASVNANRFQWDFGDGRSSVQENPQIVFDRHGTYQITLIALNAESKTDTVRRNLTITPGKCFIDSVIVEQIPFIDSNGASWDIGNGPDLQWDLEDSTDQVLLSSNTILDVLPSDLPIRYYSDPPFRVNDWGMYYWIYLWDEDIDGWDFITLFLLVVNSEIRDNGYSSSLFLENVDRTARVRLVVHWE